MPSSCCLSSGDLLSHHFVGFVKSQEGENEDGNEGELVVKFIDALPKVSWKYPYGREAFHLHPISNIKSFAYIILFSGILLWSYLHPKEFIRMQDVLKPSSL